MVGMIIPDRTVGGSEFQGFYKCPARLAPMTLHVERHAPAYPKFGDIKRTVERFGRRGLGLLAEFVHSGRSQMGPEFGDVGPVRPSLGIAGIEINRKVLADLAIVDQAAFSRLVAVAKETAVQA